jgi:hypothetical protein
LFNGSRKLGYLGLSLKPPVWVKRVAIRVQFGVSVNGPGATS